MSKLASFMTLELGRTININFLNELKIKVKEIMSDNFSPSWMTPLIQYLKGNLMPVNPPEARTHKCHTNSL